MAQFRCGMMAEALASLTQSNDLNEQRIPADLAFLALTQHRLGQSEKALATLAQLREVVKRWKDDPEAAAFLREAEAIEFDLAFPANPFAP